MTDMKTTDGQLVTTQLTSKGLKKAFLIEWCIFVLGALMLFGSETGSGAGVIGLLLMIGGFTGLVITSIIKWWRHG